MQSYSELPGIADYMLWIKASDESVAAATDYTESTLLLCIARRRKHHEKKHCWQWLLINTV